MDFAPESSPSMPELIIEAVSGKAAKKTIGSQITVSPPVSIDDWPLILKPQMPTIEILLLL